MQNFEKILDKFLRYNKDNHRYNEIISEFNKKLDSYQQIVIYGAGVITAPAILELLRAVNRTSVAIADSDSNKWGRLVEGIPICSIAKIKEKYGTSGTLVIIAVRGDYKSYIAINNILKENQFFDVMQCNEWLRYREILRLSDYNMMSNQTASLIIQNKDKIEEVYQLLIDEQSKLDFLEIINKRLIPYDCEFYYHNASYFPEELCTDDTFHYIVDCGAYRGDTFDEFLKNTFNFKKYYMFEMDPYNLKKLYEKINSYNDDIKSKCVIFPYAVGKINGHIKIHEDNSVGSYIDEKEGNSEVICRTIDELLLKSKVSLIKMDIEGGEYDALLGAENVIKKQRPVLVISLYHKDDDLWTIPSLLSSMVDNYSGFVRQEGLFEYLYYFIPQEKMK